MNKYLEKYNNKMQELSFIDSKNKKRVWNIRVEDKGDHSLIITEYGVEGGKMIRSEELVSNGKNLDKSNSTNHYTQALSQAKSKHDKKLSSTNYKPHNTDIETVQSHLPMLALDFSKNSDKIIYPVNIQPKLDGYRGIYDPETKKISSRTGKEWVSLQNTELYRELLLLDFVSDGELFCHDPDFKFEHLGVLRKKKLSVQDYKDLNCIEYWIYDIIDLNKTFSERYQLLQDCFTKHKFIKLKLVETKLAKNLNEINECHSKYISDGFEGSIIRNCMGIYRESYRSPQLLKFKDFQDAEFEIIGFDCEKSHLNDNKYIIWKCKTNDVKEFTVQSSGTAKERMDSFKNGKRYIGSKLWVKFFEYTNDNVPRFGKMARTNLQDCIRNTVI
jgi:DNA ligase-1